MLIRHNFLKTKEEGVVSLKEINQQYDNEQVYPMQQFQVHPLIPQVPINSALLAQTKEGNKMVEFERQESQFSFKQKKLLISEQPLLFDDDLPFHFDVRNPQRNQHFVKPEAILINNKFTYKLQQQKSIVKDISKVGKLINRNIFPNISQKFQLVNPSNDQQPEVILKKHPVKPNKSINEALNKIKSLKIHNVIEQTKSQCAQNPPQNQRYSKTFKSEIKFHQQTDSSIEGTPIKKSVINNIRAQIQRTSFSMNKKAIPQQNQDSEANSIIFDLKSLQRKPKKEREDLLQMKNKSFLVRGSNKKTRKPQTEREVVVVSYKTSILQLKELCSRYDQTIKIIVKIPEIFSKLLFLEDDDEEEMFNKAKTILKGLQIYSDQPLTIRKYYNCVIVLVQGLAIMSYFSGHIYLGGWTDCKNGLGLEWFPKRFVYYGQYRDNKREGYGILKDQNGQTLLGRWINNHYIDNQ